MMIPVAIRPLLISLIPLFFSKRIRQLLRPIHLLLLSNIIDNLLIPLIIKSHLFISPNKQMMKKLAFLPPIGRFLCIPFTFTFASSGFFSTFLLATIFTFFTFSFSAFQTFYPHLFHFDRSNYLYLHTIDCLVDFSCEEVHLNQN